MSTSIRHYFKYIKNGIPIELFQILKDDAVKVLHSICQQIWKTQQWPQNWEDQFSFQSQRKAMPKFYMSYFNSTWTVNFPIFKLYLEKVDEPEIKLPTSVGSLKKQESSRKTCTSALLNLPKLLTVWITTNCGKFFKKWEYQTT